MRLLLAIALLSLAACQGDDSAYSEAAPAMMAMDIQAAQAPAAQSPAVPASGPATSRAPRVLVRTAEMRIDVRDYAAARTRALATARRLGAVVSGEDERRSAYEVANTLTLRVDAARFDSLLDAMAGLGEVTARSVSVEDVTEQAVDLDARLRARRAVEARYVEILSRAASVEDVLAVEKQLAETREEIERADAQQRSLRDRVALSTLRLTLAEESATGIADGPGFGSRLADAFGSGWDLLLGLLVGLVSLWPLAFVIPAVVWLWRRVRSAVARRRPTAAQQANLDHPAGTV
ncbi:MAG TPA: DUF4349 domain-containing protein [Rubricoccaceae bacterium]|jgi:hypothetical protein